MVQRKRKSILRAKARARDGRRYVLSVDWPVDRANKPRCNLIANAPAENTCASDEFRSLPLLLSHLEPTVCPLWNWIHVLRSRCRRSLVNIKTGGLKYSSSLKNFKDILNISACTRILFLRWATVSYTSFYSLNIFCYINSVTRYW